MNLERLKAKLEAVPISYPEFVESLLLDVEIYGIGEELEEFIDKHPEANSGNVLEFEMKLIGLI